MTHATLIQHWYREMHPLLAFIDALAFFGIAIMLEGLFMGISIGCLALFV